VDIIENLAKHAAGRPEQLKRMSDEGNKVIAYTGRFIPEELVYACGGIPFLLCRGGEPEPTEAPLPYVLRYMSPFARAQIGYHLLGLDPVIPMCDLVVAQCVDCNTARLADLFEYFQIRTEKVGVPADWERAISLGYYKNALERLAKNIERITGVGLSEKRLRNCVNSMNKVRSKLQNISAMRKRPTPCIGGYDFIRLNHYSFYCDPAYFADRLDDLYGELKKSNRKFSKSARRILLAGHVIAVGDYVVPKLIEESGGVVVFEFLDEGIRQYLCEVSTEGNMLENLARSYYVERIPPSVFQPAWEKRMSFLKEKVKEFRVEGVIWYQISFEEIYNLEYSILSKAMQQMGIPLLKLESSYEYAREAMGPLTTRIESFIASINSEGEKLNG